MAKSEADANHFYYGRRASTRIQTELMVAVYDKALKRKDFAGVVDAGARAEAQAAKDARDARDAKAKQKDGRAATPTPQGTATKKDDGKDTGPKKGAQLSKILNLMSVDASTVRCPFSSSSSSSSFSFLLLRFKYQILNTHFWL
jgi:hypothetical protein